MKSALGSLLALMLTLPAHAAEVRLLTLEDIEVVVDNLKSMRTVATSGPMLRAGGRGDGLGDDPQILPGTRATQVRR